jgi:hypothetical protein
MDDAQFVEICKRLDVLIALFIRSLPDNNDEAALIRSLKDAGFQPKEIALLVGKTSNAVRVGLSRDKRKRGVK